MEHRLHAKTIMATGILTDICRCSQSFQHTCHFRENFLAFHGDFCFLHLIIIEMVRPGISVEKINNCKPATRIASVMVWLEIYKQHGLMMLHFRYLMSTSYMLEFFIKITNCGKVCTLYSITMNPYFISCTVKSYIGRFPIDSDYKSYFSLIFK